MWLKPIFMLFLMRLSQKSNLTTKNSKDTQRTQSKSIENKYFVNFVTFGVKFSSAFQTASY